jgi:hypothetical protein
MAMDSTLVGGTSGNKAEVTAANFLKIIPETDALTNSANIGGFRVFGENDGGQAAPYGTVKPYLVSGEIDLDYRKRVVLDVLLDEEEFTYTAQNFTKHAMLATTFVPTWSSNGYTTQATTPITTAAAASSLRTYKTFSIQGTETISLDMSMAFTFATGSALASPIVIEAGLGLFSGTTPYDQVDGVYLRLTSAGMFLVMRKNNNSDTAVAGPFWAPDGLATNVWQPVSGRNYQFILYLHSRNVQLWIGDPTTDLVWLANSLPYPASASAPTASPSLQFFLRQYQATAPSVGAYAALGRYSVRRGGVSTSSSINEQSARTIDSSLSPGTLVTTVGNTVTSGSVTRPSAAALSNTAVTVSGLSGIMLETATLAIGTDGMIIAYQNPATATATGTTFPQARRLRIDGVRIGSSVQTAFTAGGFVKHFYIAYGSTNVSLAGVTADTVNTKADRRVMLEFTQAYTATQAAGTLPTVVGSPYITFKTPLYVNPGEFVKLCSYHIGTAGVTGVLQHNVSFDYAWE